MIERYGRHLKTSMENLSQLFSEFEAEEKNLQDCLIMKNWTELESVITSMNRLSEEINRGEVERTRCVERIKTESGLCNTASVFEIIAVLPEPLRGECSDAYRKLKCAVLLVKSYAGNINSFVTTASSSLREILDELYPDRKGKLYTRSGRAQVTRGDALVLNRRM